jgi:hypothetical protein
MNANGPKDIGELLRDSKKIQQAIQAAVHEAVRTHKLLGRPIVVWRDGKVVWVPADQIELPGEKNGTPGAS